MTREEAAASFNPRLVALTPLTESFPRWPLPDGGRLSLRLRFYATDMAFPVEMVSSVRAVVFKKSRVILVRTHDGERHIVPGGRVESGETIHEAVAREVREETGWTIGPVSPLGFYHFRHLDPEPPPGFPFPWCDFLNPIFVADAVSYASSHRDRTQIEAGSRLTSVAAALAQIDEEQRAVLTAAAAMR